MFNHTLLIVLFLMDYGNTFIFKVVDVSVQRVVRT